MDAPKKMMSFNPWLQLPAWCEKGQHELSVDCRDRWRLVEYLKAISLFRAQLIPGRRIEWKEGEPPPFPLFAVLKSCQECSPPQSLGKTFPPHHARTFGGRPIGEHAEPEADGNYGVAARDQRLTEDFLESTYGQNQFEHNDDSAVREWLFSKVGDVRNIIEDQSIRQIQERWGIPYYTARQGKIGILSPQTPDMALPATPDPRLMKRPPRKCQHGVTMHRDDRRGRSRQCSVCNPYAHGAGRPREKVSRIK